MAKFTDAAGREWRVDFSVAAIKRCRADLGIDLARLTDNEFRPFVEVAGDPVRLADCLYLICRGQHPAVSLDEFYEAVAGDIIEQAAIAFQEAFLSFCPSRQREALKTLAAKTEEMETAVLKAIMETPLPSTQTGASSTTATGSAA
jgi:hypothetical protein